LVKQSATSKVVEGSILDDLFFKLSLSFYDHFLKALNCSEFTGHTFVLITWVFAESKFYTEHLIIKFLVCLHAGLVSYHVSHDIRILIAWHTLLTPIIIKHSWKFKLNCLS